jgi:hypothetical protein
MTSMAFSLCFASRGIIFDRIHGFELNSSFFASFSLTEKFQTIVQLLLWSPGQDYLNNYFSDISKKISSNRSQSQRQFKLINKIKVIQLFHNTL